MAYVAANTSDITLVPWVALSQLCRKMFGRNSLPAIANSASAQQLAPTASEKAAPDSTDTSPASVS
ncbi:hypothetical protein EV174_006161, partial [Coemansia sp. RSA 2320]